MAEKYVAVDSGKYQTKLNVYDKKAGLSMQKFRTKISPGTFDDDMIGNGTFIVQVDDGDVFKIGREAKQEAVLESSKKSDIHKICTLAATAIACGGGEHGGVNIAIGIPYQTCQIPEERLDYKKFILGIPGEKHKVKIKTSSNAEPVTSVFSFNRQLVYPEGIGVLYEHPAKLSDGPTGIIDIGNLNINCLSASLLGGGVFDEACFTDELGGKILIAGLAQTLTSELGSRCDENLVASTLLKPLESRHLTSKKGNTELEKKSKEIIKRAVIDHVAAIKRGCDSKHWPIDFMNIVCLGGTAKLLKNEIYQVFGEETFIPEFPEYVNVCGFLKKMCADDGIDVAAETKANKEPDKKAAA